MIMKTKFLLSIVLAFLSQSIFAQITLKSGDQIIKGGDTVVNAFATNAALLKLPLFKKGDNQTWDFSQVAFQSQVGGTVFKKSNNPNYPKATFFYNSTANLGPISFPIEVYNEKATDGIWDIGFENKAVKSTIQPITGNIKDSLYLPAVTLKYEIPVYIYPSKNGDKTIKTKTLLRPYALTVAGFNLNKVPGEVKTKSTNTIEIIGYGKVTLPDFKNKGKSVTYNALLQKLEIINEDSIFLGGAPAPPTLLQAFGLQQGQVSKQYYLEWLVPGFKMWSAYAITNDKLVPSTFAVSVESGFVAGGSTSAKDFVGEWIDSKAFPNPSADGTFAINFEKKSPAPWTIKIFDLQGRVVSEQSVNGEGERNEKINLNGGQGTYFYSIFNEKEQFINNGILIKN
jgi:Secretion system C-terminal sorting domain